MVGVVLPTDIEGRFQCVRSTLIPRNSIYSELIISLVEVGYRILVSDL